MLGDDDICPNRVKIHPGVLPSVPALVVEHDLVSTLGVRAYRGHRYEYPIEAPDSTQLRARRRRPANSGAGVGETVVN
jgi:hypothetical protein